MGYETKIIVAVSKEDYPGGVDWGKHLDLIEYQDEDMYKYRYEFFWSKTTSLALDYFLDEVVDEEDELVEETYGAILIGEFHDDVREHGNPWDFDIELQRTLTMI